MRVAVVGLWHLGEVYAACLAKLGHSVVGIEEDRGVVDNFKRGIAPLAEPGLDDMLRSKNLTFTSDYAETRGAEMVWITIDTPVGKNDEADTSSIDAALKKIVPHIKDGTVIVVSSQLPIGSSSRLQKFLKKKLPHSPYAYVPENLRLGEAVKSFMEPGRVVIGASDSRAAETVTRALTGLSADFLVMTPPSAELVKHALNAFLATSLSFIYDIADVAEKAGADILDVSKALKSDERIGSRAYLDASLGFSGGTLGRDLQYLLKSGSGQLPVISAAFKKNETRRTQKLISLLSPLGTLKGKRIALLGLTYKSGTTTLRRSMALECAEVLRKRGAVPVLFDAYVDSTAVQAAAPKCVAVGTIYEACTGAHAVVLVTPWSGVRDLEWSRLGTLMKKPRLFVDTRNTLATAQEVIRAAGVQYKGIGR